MRVLQHMHVPRSIAYSPDGSTMAVGDEAELTLYALPGLEVSGRLRVGDGIASVEALAFSPDSAWLAAGVAGGAIRIWDARTREVLCDDAGHQGGVRGIAWGTEPTEIVSVGWDRCVRWWTAKPLEHREPLAASAPLTCLVMHPDNSVACGSSHGSLFFWRWGGRPKWWRPEKPIDAPPTYALALTRDGKTLAAGHADGRITIWDFAKRKRIGELTGHDWVVYGLAFTPDGGRLVSGGADGAVRLWDVPHRRLVETYNWHKSWVTCVAVAPDGMTAATGADDYDVVVWDLADA
jgi:WD40 repeat protein